MVLGRLKLAIEAPIGRFLNAAAGMGIGLGYFWINGSRDKYAISTKNDRSVLVYFGGSCELRAILAKHIWMPLSLNVGTLSPGITLLFEGEEAATAGLPTIEIGLGVTFVFGNK
jgi:hypothetical protein